MSKYTQGQPAQRSTTVRAPGLGENSVVVAVDEGHAGRAWRRFLGRYLRAVEEVLHTAPRAEHDPDRPSECELGEPDEDGLVAWRPVPRTPPGELRCCTQTAGLVDPELVEVLAGWWSMPIEATLGGVPLVLLTAASQPELDALDRALAEGFARTRREENLSAWMIARFHDGRVLRWIPSTGVWAQREDTGWDFITARLGDFYDTLVPIAV